MSLLSRKRTLAALLGVSLALSLMAGCGQSATGETQGRVRPSSLLPEGSAQSGESGAAEGTAQPTETAGPEAAVPTETAAPTLGSEPSGQTDPARETEPQQVTVPLETLPGVEDYPDLAIETPYVTLYYPGRWEQHLRVETQTLDFGASVAFYGTFTAGEQWLFTVHFGGGEGISAGAVLVDGGYLMDVTVELSDYVPGEGWSAEDTDLFSAMQEDMNHLIGMLAQEPGYQG